uniref:Uncharacterized protein n=1 Tax=Panagrolaimus sp. JU765 TaxID=591449 RepID=A0AC34PW08_9BILA
MCGLCRPIRRKRPKNENNSISGTTTLDTSTFARLSTSHGTILNNLGNNSSTNDKNINKQTGNEFNPMLDASKQDDENDQLFHVRRADQPSQNQPISPRAMSIFNQGKPPPTIVKAGSLPPLGVVKSSNQANQYQGPYGFPPQTTQSMGFPQVRQPADFIDYPEATMPRSYQVDYEDQMVGEMNYRPPVDYKIPANFAYPQAIPNPQQMNFR